MKSCEKMKLYIIPVLCGVLAVLVGVMLFVLLRSPERETSAFTPPPFEENAVSGVPDVPEELGYSSPYKEGMSYRFSVCGNVETDGTNAVVYFTNPADNEVWLKVRILDENSVILGESGLLKPGEYVKDVCLSSVPDVGARVSLKIMGYEPQTYCSAGSATLNTTVGAAAK